LASAETVVCCSGEYQVIRFSDVESNSDLNSPGVSSESLNREPSFRIAVSESVSGEISARQPSSVIVDTGLDVVAAASLEKIVAHGMKLITCAIKRTPVWAIRDGKVKKNFIIAPSRKVVNCADYELIAAVGCHQIVMYMQNILQHVNHLSSGSVK
jgi:hypothetical protein